MEIERGGGLMTVRFSSSEKGTRKKSTEAKGNPLGGFLYGKEVKSKKRFKAKWRVEILQDSPEARVRACFNKGNFVYERIPVKGFILS